MNRSCFVVAALLGCAFACTPPHPNPDPEPDGGTPTSTLPRFRTDWTNGAVVYEVFVRSFADSNGDGKGDLKGLISKLDYLNDGNPNTTTDLGVDALWLMPVFASPSYHGYDIVDYENINPDYGNNDDFTQLCNEAHRRGMKVILDFVINHTGSGHPWFVDSSSSSASAKRDWYVWNTVNPGWKQPWGGGATWYALNGSYYYGVFWSGMPDLNLKTQAVREELQRLAALWLGRGADGFRLDAARYLIETGPNSGQQDTIDTHAFWKEFAAAVRAIRPDAMLVGEAWADTPTIAKYYGDVKTVVGGDELPMNFDFPLAGSILQFVTSGEAPKLAEKLAEVKTAYPPGVTDAPFLTNHDQPRSASQLGLNLGRMKNAAALLLTLPGSPFIYYGEELGMQNGTTANDEAKRTPFPWDSSATGGFTSGTPWFSFSPGYQTANVAAETGDPSSLLSRYRKLIRAHHASPALVRGTIQLLTLTWGYSATLAYVRNDGTERVLVVHNLTDTFATAGPYDLSEGIAEQLFADDSVGISGGGGAWRVSLAPRGTGIWRLR